MYRGRRSSEIGLGVSFRRKRYSISEMIRASDVEHAKQFRNMVARDDAMLETALAHLRENFLRYGARSLENDKAYFKKLDELRVGWIKAYGIDTLIMHTRPKAAAAFKRGEYRAAAELYSKIEGRLSPAELKKLEIARKRSGIG